MVNLVDRFILHIKTRLGFSKHTERAYRKDLYEFISFLSSIKVDLPSKIDRVVLRRYLSFLALKGFSRNTLIRKISSVRSFVSFLVLEKILQTNPFEVLLLPKKDKNLPSFLTEEEIIKLIDSNRPDVVLKSNPNYPFAFRDFALLMLLYSSGLRRSELVGLNIGDVDLVSGFVRVFGKGRRERIVPVGENAIKAILDYLETLPDDKKNPSSPLFINKYGQRLSDTYVFLLLRKMAKRARFTRPVKPHMLRHTFATHLINNGCDIRAVSEMLGHSSLSTTQVYTHLTIEKLKEIYNRYHPRSRS